jgi:hypothetical protein
MEKDSSFIKSYKTALEDFNKYKKIQSTSLVKDANLKGLNVRTLAVVCLMLVHLKDDTENKYDLNIDTIHSYDLNNLNVKYYNMFDEYIKYVIGGGKDGWLKKDIGKKLYAAFVATFVRYLFIIQIKKIERID